MILFLFILITISFLLYITGYNRIYSFVESWLVSINHKYMQCVILASLLTRVDGVTIQEKDVIGACNIIILKLMGNACTVMELKDTLSKWGYSFSL